MKKRFFITGLFLCAILLVKAQFPYKNKALSPEERAVDLASRLTLEEKVSLMMNSSKAIPGLDIEKYDWWNEALHGVARNGLATVFPQAIGMAASFDDQFVNDVFTVVSDEARVKHRIARAQNDFNRYQGLTMWTPNINIFRDPRWGRGQETYGEDPYLTGTMGVAVIKGLQGEATDGYDKLHACAKHYAVHSGPEWNRHSFNADSIAPRDLWETYLPAFKVAVQKGNVKEVMCAYNRFEGTPCCGSNRLLTQILREQWGFDGIVLSDCGAINNFYTKGAHMTHPTQESASAAAVLSGTDLECGSSYKSITEAVKQGLINEEQLDISLIRILKARFELGEMDHTSPWDNLADSLVNCQEHQKMALDMAHKTMVLLQNNGILPLKAPKSIAVFGPNADNEKMQWGNYNGFPNHTITLLEALRDQLPETEIIYDKICDYTGDTKSLFAECNNKGEKGFLAIFWNNTEMQGDAANQMQYESEIKIGKSDAVAPGMKLAGISAKFASTLIPQESGPVEFVFITKSKVKLRINGSELKLTNQPIVMQLAELEVEAGKPYHIEVDLIQKKHDNFRFDIKQHVKTDVDKIIELAKKVDVVIYAGGINAVLEGEESNVYAPGFMGGDRTNIELPKAQREIIEAIKNSGKKVVLVNFSGSAMGLVPETKNCDAILQAWYPGEAGGMAIANVLLGKYNPAGRLPVTFYKSADQIPDFENYDMRGRTYRYMKDEPLFPFGYGLSYTTFSYGKVKLNTKKAKIGDTITLKIDVTNMGNYDGDDVVQVYLRKKNDTGGPFKTLRAYKRVSIPAGESVSVEFELTNENLEWWDKKNQTVHMHTGEYQLMVGGNSDDKSLISADFKLY